MRGRAVQGSAKERQEDCQGTAADNGRISEVEHREVLNGDEVDDVPAEDSRRPEDPVSQIAERAPKQQAQSDSPRKALKPTRDTRDDHDNRDRDRREHSSESLARTESRTRVTEHLKREHTARYGNGLLTFQPRDSHKLAAEIQGIGESGRRQQSGQRALSQCALINSTRCCLGLGLRGIVGSDDLLHGC